uniref:NADH-ubiquinone oxidoreductase chain 4 n=1 Tax=Laodelphax striatellus TaxID=195883 RepID=A0A4Y5UPM1_LAOST|nr:NADH dehydrogenase subunit 4 [Laodelphax striatellus]
MLSYFFLLISLTLLSLKMNLFFLIYFFFFMNLVFLTSAEAKDFFSYISFNMGLDYYSFCMILLTFWLFILMMYGMLNLKLLYFSYLSMLLFLMFFFLFLCFVTLSFFSFYIYFECSILPVFFLIYGWGYQPERVFSSLYFFFYTLFSSLPLLILIFSLNNLLGYFYFYIDFSSENLFLFFFFIFSFLVKLPMFFFHLWLPKAHVEGPTIGSMILSGVMLKLGGYGLIRVLYMFTSLVNCYSFFFMTLSLIGALYVGLFCLLQSDSKVLVAYSSVSHMSLVICGLMSLSWYGFTGSLYLMLSHGLISSGLFYFVGCLFDRLGTRSMFLMKGLINLSPSLVMFFFLLVVSNMSCPPSLNLISELLICFSLMGWDYLSLIYIFFTLFFSACAMICWFSFVSHGYTFGLVLNLDSGFVREYYLFFMHLTPLYLFFLNLDFFI